MPVTSGQQIFMSKWMFLVLRDFREKEFGQTWGRFRGCPKKPSLKPPNKPRICFESHLRRSSDIIRGFYWLSSNRRILQPELKCWRWGAGGEEEGKEEEGNTVSAGWKQCILDFLIFFPLHVLCTVIHQIHSFFKPFSILALTFQCKITQTLYLA